MLLAKDATIVVVAAPILMCQFFMHRSMLPTESQTTRIQRKIPYNNNNNNNNNMRFRHQVRNPKISGKLHNGYMLVLTCR